MVQFGMSAGEKAAGPFTELGKYLEHDVYLHLFPPLLRKQRKVGEQG